MDNLKIRSSITFLFLLVTFMTLAVRWAAAQNDQILQVFLSNEQKRDPAQMEATQMFKVGDPIYFVLVIDPKNNIKVGDLVSTNPTTKEKNVFICFQLASSTMENTCPGLLKAPFSQEVLNGKSIVYPIIPATNDVNAVNMDEIRAILKGFQSMYGTVDLKVILKHFDSNGNVILECEVDLDGWNTSRWREYLSLFLTRDNAAQKERDLIASDSKPLPQSKLNDPALEKEITLQSPILFGPKYRIYKAVINQSNWEYVKNEFGILLYRRIYLAVMMKNVESGECMIDYEAIAREDYLHGNVYDKVYLALPHVRDRSLVRCERFVGFK